MTDLFVDDILGARPSLRERAKAAKTDSIEAENRRRADEEDALVADAVRWLGEKLGCTSYEIEDIRFVRGPKSSDGSQRQINFEVDGIKFRCFYTKVKKHSIATNGGTDRMSIEEDELTMQASGSGAAWVVVFNLADVGGVVQ